MEGLPSGDIQAKYQKLASEYSKLRVHVKVLKKGVLDEQAKSNELREVLKSKEKVIRQDELEIDSLTFRNQQLTRRVSVLQDELDALQNKLSKKTKSKSDEKQSTSSVPAPLDPGLLQEELQKKIIENAQLASQIGSEDALSSVDELNINEQLSTKALTLDQENQKLRMEYEILQMENESLKLEIAKHVSAAQKRKGESHDSGDFNTFNETSVDAEGRMTGLLGSLEEEELHSTSHNYEQQMSVLTEHVAGLNEQLARQHDQLEMLRHQLAARRK
ncbi:KLRAQ motif-containing protein 1 [Papilio machaon]|uniref:KLRAQ motif-containing protein 1 n=1 Tax=Papilio machaon TaxID=76193 RepID=A0A0N0PB85_PAPMA|nr:KLRAQ motif-containing protein 1 [Papilio machaon]